MGPETIPTAETTKPRSGRCRLTWSFYGQGRGRSTRVLVTVVLDALAAGLSATEIVEHYPTLTVDDVRAAAAYGARLAV